MKVLVTGATGNVGRYVVEELKQQGEAVRAAGTDLKKLRQLFGEDVEAVRFDFLDPSTYPDALDSVDRVFLVRPPHLGKPRDLYPFIDAMAQRQIKLVTFLSLMGVENNTIPPHHKIEKYIEAAGIPYAHIRPGFFMQNISGIHAREIIKDNQVFVPAGNSKTSFIDAADIAAAAAVLLHHPERYRNTAHTITGPEALDYHQVARILSEVTGRDIRYAKPGLLRYRKHYIRHRKLDKNYVNITAALYLMTRMGTAREVTSGFYDITGRQPRTLKEYALKNADCFTSAKPPAKEAALNTRADKLKGGLVHG